MSGWGSTLRPGACRSPPRARVALGGPLSRQALRPAAESTQHRPGLRERAVTLMPPRGPAAVSARGCADVPAARLRELVHATERDFYVEPAMFLRTTMELVKVLLTL